MMEMDQWLPKYRRIVKELKYDPDEDRRAAIILDDLLKDRALPLKDIRQRVNGRPTLIFGAGPSLENDLKRILKTTLLSRCCLISADGATTALLKIAGKVPDIVVTDLDGVVEDIQEAERRGAYIVVHAHGDNIPKLERYVKTFSKALGTTQTEPVGRVHNFGGFTDGDRAVFLAGALGGDPLALAGMDMGETVGPFSKTQVASPKVKVTKLRIGKNLLEWFASTAEVTLFNLTSGGEDISGFERIFPEELGGILADIG